MGSFKVVIDTNVVISALLFGGAPGKLVAFWQRGIIKPKATKEIIDEYLRVLAYPKFELSEKEINYVLYHVCISVIVVDVVTMIICKYYPISIVY